MLQGRLTRPALLAAAAALTLAACAGVDGTDRGAIREAVIEPGITAIDDSKALACSADAQSIMTAMEIHELMDGRPAADEAELVEAGRLRAESALWDVVDGRLVPADEQCGAVPTDIGEIVTGPEPAPITPAQYLESVDAAEIEALGGYDCALEVAEVSIAYGEYAIETGSPPLGLDELVRTGRLTELDLWFVADRGLEAVPGTACRGPLPVGDEITVDECAVELRTLEVAVEAYEALTGERAPGETALIERELVRERMLSHDVVDGRVLPALEQCENLVPSEPRPAEATVCDEEYFRLRIALDTYMTDIGVDAADERELVDAGYLVNGSELWDVVDGRIVVAEGIGCEPPG